MLPPTLFPVNVDGLLPAFVIAVNDVGVFEGVTDAGLAVIGAVEVGGVNFVGVTAAVTVPVPPVFGGNPPGIGVAVLTVGSGVGVGGGGGGG